MTRLEGKYSTYQEPLYQEVVQPKSTETTPCMVLPMGNAVFPVALEGLMVEHQSFMYLSACGSIKQGCTEDAKWNNNDRKGPWSQGTLKRASTKD